MNSTTFAAIAVMLLVALLVAGSVYQTFPEAREEAQAFESWCSDQDGTLVNVHSFAHGGLHCEFDNGTSLHVWEVNTTSEGSNHE